MKQYKLSLSGVTSLMIIGLLSSCAGAPQRRQTPKPVVTAPPATQAPATDNQPGAPQPQSDRATQPAVVALIEEADRHTAQGQRDQAAASLERALRIQPRDATLWHLLASIKFAQGQFEQAQDLAAKSNALAGENHRLKAANWDLIAEAKTKLGDHAGAAKARQQAKQLGTF